LLNHWQFCALKAKNHLYFRENERAKVQQPAYKAKKKA
jgi:hypothetical protein